MSQVLVDVIEETIILETGETVVEIFEVGIQGPPGTGGGAGASFSFVSVIPTATWTINHNLGFEPDVTCKTLGGLTIEGEIAHQSINQVIVYWNAPQAGTARCE